MSEDQTTQQMLLLEDSHANHSALQEKEKEQQMIAISGMKLLESLPNANRGGLLEKMLKDLLTSTTAWSSDRCKLIWKSKVSKSNVLLFQLQASVLGIKGKESGLLPTPTTMDHIDRKGMRPSRAATNRKTGYLSEMIKMYPTPVVSDHLHNQSESIENWQKRAKEKKKQGINLHFALRHHVQMYPTPTPACEEGGEQSSRVEMTDNGGFILRKKNKPEMTFGAKLSDAMLYLEKQLYNTPTTNDAKNLTFPKSQTNRTSIVGNLIQQEQVQTWWQTQSEFCGVPNGISFELDKDRANRIKSLGNSIVPQIARQIGLSIMKAELN
jgi:hypothetical protein